MYTYCLHNKCADIKIHVGFAKICLFKWLKYNGTD